MANNIPNDRWIVSEAKNSSSVEDVETLERCAAANRILDVIKSNLAIGDALGNVCVETNDWR
jgi:hypothetical protein